MKHLHIILLILAGVISMASANGVAEEQNKDRTGSPDGSPTCITCHTGGGFSPSVSIQLLDDNDEAVTALVPEAMYTMRVSVSNFFPFPDVYGFQATALMNDLSNAGEFANPGVNVQLENVDNTTISNRHVIEHSSPGFTGNFSADWTAPNEGDSVYFYAAGVTGNGNNEPEGDNGSSTMLTLPLVAADGVEESLLSNLEVRTIGGELWISDNELALINEVNMYSLSGVLLFTQRELGLPFALSLQDINQPFFLINIKHEGFENTYKVIAP